MNKAPWFGMGNVRGAKPSYCPHRPDGTLRPSYKNDSVDVQPTKKYSKKSSSSSSDDDTDNKEDEDESKSEHSGASGDSDKDSSKQHTIKKASNLKRTAKRKVRRDHTKNGDTATTSVMFSSEEINEDSSKNEADDASTANEMETANNPQSTSSSIQFNSDIVYYDVFTAFQRHLNIQSSEIDVLHSIITKIHVADPQRNQNKQSIRDKQQVDSWNTKQLPARKDILYLHDDNIGEDSLSSQSTYLHDFCCQRHEFDDALLHRHSDIEYRYWNHPRVDLKKLFKFLSVGVYELLFNDINRVTRQYIDVNGSIIGSKIAEIGAHLVVARTDDIEFWDWAESTQSHCLWYSSNVSNSPLLCAAIKKALSKSRNYSKIDPDYVKLLDKGVYQFMGFVSRSLERSYLSCFHLVSFVLF